jgi:hypothetical protein
MIAFKVGSYRASKNKSMIQFRVVSNYAKGMKEQRADRSQGLYFEKRDKELSV